MLLLENLNVSAVVRTLPTPVFTKKTSSFLSPVLSPRNKNRL